MINAILYKEFFFLKNHITILEKPENKTPNLFSIFITVKLDLRRCFSKVPKFSTFIMYHFL